MHVGVRKMYSCPAFDKVNWDDPIPNLIISLRTYGFPVGEPDVNSLATLTNTRCFVLWNELVLIYLNDCIN